MYQIESYSSPVNLSVKEALNFFGEYPYIVQEKVDGSQFSFGVYNINDFLIPACRSHGTQINIDQPPKIFAKAVETIKNIWGNLMIGWTYRGEVLDKPKHNKLQYNRVPTGNIILYDIDTGDQNYLQDDNFYQEVERIGLEAVPTLALRSGIPTQEDFDSWLDNESILGGTKIEGVVLKNYRTFDSHNKLLMVKYVSEMFREKANKEWKGKSLSSEVVTTIVAEFGSQARWDKVIQHLAEEDILSYTPKDIGLVMKEFNADFERECVDEIKDRLWILLRKEIMHGVCGNLPDYYKKFLQNKFYEESNES